MTSDWSFPSRELNSEQLQDVQSHSGWSFPSRKLISEWFPNSGFRIFSDVYEGIEDFQSVRIPKVAQIEDGPEGFSDFLSILEFGSEVEGPKPARKDIPPQPQPQPPGCFQSCKSWSCSELSFLEGKLQSEIIRSNKSCPGPPSCPVPMSQNCSDWSIS